MKINTVYYSLLIMLFASVSSCIEDKGNYDYEDAKDVISIEISDLPEKITTSRDINLTPTVSNLKEGVEYSYRWFCHYQTPVTEGSNEIIELGTEKDLIMTLPLPITTYYLYLEVKDVKANVFVRKRMNLEISTKNIKRGLYLLKDMDNATDFDYINFEGELYSNVLKDHSQGDLRLPGKAVRFAFQPITYNHQIIENGNVVETLKNQSVFHVISDEEYFIIRELTMERLKRFEDAFYEVPAIKKPQFVNYLSSGYKGTVLMNAGKIHTIYQGGSGHIGLFSYPAVLDQEYEFTATAAILGLYDILVFDKISRSFKKVSYSNGGISSFPDPSGAEIGNVSPNNMEADLIEILPARIASRTEYTGVALMKSTTDDRHYLALIGLDSDTTYPFIRIDTLTDSTLPVITSPLRAATQEGQFIYYTKGNELRSYNYEKAPSEESFQRDNLVKTFPDEEVTCVFNYLHSVSGTESFNYLVVATYTAGGKWKMYQYIIPSAGDPAIGDLKNTYEGEGKIKQIFFR